MSPIYGDITLINGRINNLKIEIGTSLPVFNAQDIGRLFFLSNNGTISVNDGNEWVTLQFSNTENSSPLLTTLGNNWINSDLSFNPTPFNALNNISGLTANDSLFSVISALDQAITNLNGQHLANLGDVAFGALNTGDIVIWGGTKFTNISMNNLANARLTLNTTSLKDVYATNYIAGDMLVYSQANSKFVNRQLMYTSTRTASDVAFSVPHNLGVQFPIVQIINYATKTSITSGYTITYSDSNNLQIILDAPAAIVILVMAVNQA